MSITFIDPGYGKGYTILQGEGLTCVESEEYNPYCGVAFTGQNCFVRPPSGYSSFSSDHLVERIYIKFNVYLDLQGSDTFSAGFKCLSDTNPDGCHIIFSSEGYKFMKYNSEVYGGTRAFSSDNKFHEVIVSVGVCYNKPYISLATDYWEVDDQSSWTSEANCTIGNGGNFFFSFPSSQASKCYVSNVIVHQELTTSDNNLNIAPDTLATLHVRGANSFKIVRLPLKNTMGDFITGENGEYIGNTAGQQLLSTIDAQSVIEKFGATSKVSHLVSYGNPGYRTGSNITTAYGLFELGGEIVTSSARSIPADPDATIFALNAMDATTLTDVDGKKIGWRV